MDGAEPIEHHLLTQLVSTASWLWCWSFRWRVLAGGTSEMFWTCCLDQHSATGSSQGQSGREETYLWMGWPCLRCSSQFPPPASFHHGQLHRVHLEAPAVLYQLKFNYAIRNYEKLNIYFQMSFTHPIRFVVVRSSLLQATMHTFSVLTTKHDQVTQMRAVWWGR